MILHRGDDDEFYVGWQERHSPDASRATAGVVRVLLGLAATAAILLGGLQGPLRGGSFEYGVRREFEGLLAEGPAPSLRVGPPGQLSVLPDGAPPAVTRWLLVARGKHGAQELVAGLDGQAVRARGSLVYRGGQTLLELSGRPEPLSAAGAPDDSPAPLRLGSVTLVGEIVDSKCSFGVMVPGEGRAHRACAIRCLSGGVPPVFRVPTDDGSTLCLLLVGRDGRALNREILDRVAEPLSITGEVERHDDLFVLRAEPGEFQPAR